MWWTRLLLVVGLQCATSALAAPPIEPCPDDSFAADGVCKCDPSKCRKPPCLSELRIAGNGTEQPGDCCPNYGCFGCKNETLIDDKCPCAEGAVIDDKGECACADAEKHLVDGVCVCNPKFCELPQLCDKKSVLVTEDGECCKKYFCKPCPEDSESTNYEPNDQLDDHCVCLPCKTECGPNKTAVVKRNGTNFPGSCCDIYECKQTDKDCTVGDIIYSNGDKWSTSDTQECSCLNGISLCTETHEERSQMCISDNKVYRLNETWTKDDGCTNCTCTNGEAKCISHFCDVKESQIHTNDRAPCVKDSKFHLEDWYEDDGCTRCHCDNGNTSCLPVECKETDAKKNECQPLYACNKTCPHGFKLNKKGCEICKCNAVRIGQDLLAKYNITMSDLVRILDAYQNSLKEKSTAARVVEEKGVVLKESNATSTTEPAVAPADKPENALVFVIIGLSSAFVVIITVVLFCVYKSKRKNSLDLSHCHYETVSTLNNNNTIKKTEQLL